MFRAHSSIQLSTNCLPVLQMLLFWRRFLKRRVLGLIFVGALRKGGARSCACRCARPAPAQRNREGGESGGREEAGADQKL